MLNSLRKAVFKGHIDSFSSSQKVFFRINTLIILIFNTLNYRQPWPWKKKLIIYIKNLHKTVEMRQYNVEDTELRIYRRSGFVRGVLAQQRSCGRRQGTRRTEWMSLSGFIRKPKRKQRFDYRNTPQTRKECRMYRITLKHFSTAALLTQGFKDASTSPEPHLSSLWPFKIVLVRE